ncbi:MAG: hypothetical protein E7439_06980 [Ruminococcaceae bacterium]|nr:hypothetical protein [Oscillospiraceae bacterium]
MDEKHNYSVEQAKKMANSDAGKQLFALLQQTQGDQLKVVMEDAASGNYAKAMQAMSAMMNSPQAKELMEKMRRQSDG